MNRRELFSTLLCGTGAIVKPTGQVLLGRHDSKEVIITVELSGRQLAQAILPLMQDYRTRPIRFGSIERPQP